MAVMLIVGLVMSMITVGIGDGNRGREVQSDIRILYQSMQLALEESVFARKQFGIRFDCWISYLSFKSCDHSTFPDFASKQWKCPIAPNAYARPSFTVTDARGPAS